MKKMIISAFFAAMCAVLFIMPATAESGELYNEYYSASGADSLESSLPDYAKKFIDSLGIDITNPESFTADSGGMISAAFSVIADGLKTPLKSLGICIAVIILCALCANMGEQTGLLGGYISVLAASVGGLVPLIGSVKNTVSAISGTGGFISAFVPVYCGILLSGGKAVTAAGFNTLLLFAAWAVSSVISVLIVPAVSMYIALMFSVSVSDLKLSGLCDGIKKSATFMLGLSLTLFCGLLGIQTSVAAAGDNVTIKTARFVAGSFLPVVGSAVGEALGTVSSCIGMLRSTVGAYGIVGIIALLLPVFAELAAWRGVTLICESVAELFECKKLGSLFKNVGSAVSVLLGIIIWVALLFIISLTIVVATGKGTT